MINKEVRQRIEKTIGKTEDIDAYFRECYRRTVNNENFIIVAPVNNEGDCTMVFVEDTGEFAGLERWSVARKEGVLL